MLRIKVKITGRDKILGVPLVGFCDEWKTLKSNERWLYTVLEEIARKQQNGGWLKEKGIELERRSGLSRMSIWRARKALVKAGLIEEEQ